MNIVEPIRDREHIAKVENYLAKKSLRNQLIFVFGVNTGLRISDILALNVEDVLNKTCITIREKKTGKYKKFPLNEKLQNLIKSYIKDKEVGEALFIGKKGKRLDRSQVYRFLNEACKDTGMDIAIGTHTMRKSFGYHHYKQFNDVVLLQKILNHSSQAITLRYIDPPYNTRKEFVYNDKFEFSDEKLKEMLDITNDEIQRLHVINGRSSHSAWLTFMYPRLKIARKLLTEDNCQLNL